MAKRSGGTRQSGSSTGGVVQPVENITATSETPPAYVTRALNWRQRQAQQARDRAEARVQSIINASGYTAETKGALREIARDIPSISNVRPEYNGQAIEITNITSSQWRELSRKIESAGYEVREDSDYFSGNGGTGIIWIQQIRRR